MVVSMQAYNSSNFLECLEEVCVLEQELAAKKLEFLAELTELSPNACCLLEHFFVLDGASQS